MAYNFKQVESVELKAKVVTRFAVDISENDKVAITTSSGVVVSRLCPPREANPMSVSFQREMIEPISYSLPSKLDINLDDFIGELAQDDVYESVLRGDTSSLIVNCKKSESRNIKALWGPAGTNGSECVLAVLNNFGGLELRLNVVCSTIHSRFVPFVNITEKSIEQYKSRWKNVMRADASEKFAELKRRMDMNHPTAFTWTNLFHAERNFCFLIVAYADGRLTFWKLSSFESENYLDTGVEFFGDCETNVRDVTCMHWTQSGNGGLLIMGYASGAVAAYPIENITDKSMKIGEPVRLDERNDFQTDAISSVTWQNNFFVYIFRSEFVQIYLFDSSGELLDSCRFCLGNLCVVDYRHTDGNKTLVLTMTGVLKELNVCVKDGKINLAWRNVYLNVSTQKRKIIGFFYSRNRLLFTFLVESCVLLDQRVEKDSLHFMTFLNRNVDPLELILSDGDESLRNLSDCFESIRLLAIQFKEFVWDEALQNVDYKALSMRQLKVHYILAKLAECVVDSESKPTIRAVDIQTIMKLKLSLYCAQIIIAEREAGKRVNPFKQRCLSAINTFLREIILLDFLKKLDNDNTENTYLNSIFNVLTKTDSEHSEPCWLCGAILAGSTCPGNHHDNRCIFTGVQIKKGKYYCSGCKCYLSEEAHKMFNIVRCPCCDSLFDVIQTTADIQQYDDCQIDCLRETAT